MTFASSEQLKAISLTCFSIFCAVTGYKLYLVKNFAEQLDMFPQETIDKFFQLAEKGHYQELHQFLLDFNQQGIVATFARLLTAKLLQIISLEFSYQDRITTVLIRIFRRQMHNLSIMLSKSVDVEQLQKKDARGHSALSSAINYFMEKAASIILQRISGNGSIPLGFDSFEKWRFLCQGGSPKSIQHMAQIIN